MLNSHPEVSCYGALMLPDGTGSQAAGAQKPYFFELMRRERVPRTAYPYQGWRYTDSLFADGGEHAAVGFKLMYSQFRHVPWLLAYLAVRRVRIVHLVRSNKLDHVISSESARLRGEFHLRPGQTADNPPVRLEPSSLAQRIRREERKVRSARLILRMLRVPVLEVSYEELTGDSSRFVEVLRFLRVPSPDHELTTTFRKWNRRGYRESIENFDEVSTALRGTQYGGLLESSP